VPASGARLARENSDRDQGRHSQWALQLVGALLKECIARSLRRMGIEYIDLYQVHRPDPYTHPRETASILNDA
jgi:aryl-alcohol dehydrogenase-like predicted oxidoreductase